MCPPLQKYAIDTLPLAVIEVVVFAILEAKRYDIYKKTGEVGLRGRCGGEGAGAREEEAGGESRDVAHMGCA